MSILDTLHGGYIFARRVRVLSDWMARLIPPDARVLDVGCGDGLIAKLIQEKRPDVQIHGIDTLVRPQTHVPVARFDGAVIPHAPESFDLVMFIDVLHHTEDPTVLLREALRVARHGLLIKDHYRDGFLAGPTLRLMDWIGNARHQVVLPYNYWPESRWRQAFDGLELAPAVLETDLGLYPPPLRWVFERSLHFIARLDKSRRGPGGRHRMAEHAISDRGDHAG